METVEFQELLERGEDSSTQFKKNITSADSLAADMVAFSNGAGGKILIGINDDGSVSGLSSEDVRRINQLISNTASQHVQPAINPVTKNIKTANGLVMLVDVPSGINKPYQDKNGVFWVKSGADKRKATSREEIQRIFQKAHLLHADEMLINDLTINDFDMEYFENYFLNRFGEPLAEQKQPVINILTNMNLLKDGFLTLSSALLFAKRPQYKIPISIVKAGAFDSTDIATDIYYDSRDIAGKMEDVYRQTINFIISNLHHKQNGQDFNSIGKPEIPHDSIKEIVANALIHRDYFISSHIRVFVFKDRVEIISPGHLPNNLTVENIKLGTSHPRNALLASHANHIIPYRGYGSGIINALSKYPHIDFIDDREGNYFKAILKRVC